MIIYGERVAITSIEVIITGEEFVKKALLTFFSFLLISLMPVSAEQASVNFSISVDEYMQIQTMTSSVLTANITDKTGNLYAPLYSRFKVITNSSETKTLYLRANTITESGSEDAMFEANGRVYIAFANIARKPRSQALANCKLSINPKDSPGVVAYPVDSITGADSKYLRGKNKYEINVKNGITYITVNIGSNVLKTSFASNDPKGFYQATLSLTESDI